MQPFGYSVRSLSDLNLKFKFTLEKRSLLHLLPKEPSPALQKHWIYKRSFLLGAKIYLSLKIPEFNGMGVQTSVL